MTIFIVILSLWVAVVTSWLYFKSERQYKKELSGYKLQIKTLDDRISRLSGDWLKLREEVMTLVQERELKNDNKIKESLKVMEKIQERMIDEADQYLRARSYESQKESFIDEVVDRINRKQLNV